MVFEVEISRRVGFLSVTDYTDCTEFFRVWGCVKFASAYVERDKKNLRFDGFADGYLRK